MTTTYAKFTLQLDVETDADVIAYLDVQANKNDTIRRALRSRMGEDYFHGKYPRSDIHGCDKVAGRIKKQKKYLCPECNKMLSKQEGCVCDKCGAILLADANREMFGDEAEWMEVVGMTDFGDK